MSFTSAFALRTIHIEMYVLYFCIVKYIVEIYLHVLIACFKKKIQKIQCVGATIEFTYI